MMLYRPVEDDYSRDFFGYPEYEIGYRGTRYRSMNSRFVTTIKTRHIPIDVIIYV